MFVGVSQLEYAHITYELGTGLNAFYATGAHLSVASGRISYTFGLKGPAMTVGQQCIAVPLTSTTSIFMYVGYMLAPLC